jgi:hypothetical protein
MTPHEQKAQECANLIVASMFDTYPTTTECRKIILHHFPEPQEKVCLWIIGTKSRKCGSSPIDPDKLFCPYCGGMIV